MDKQLRELMKEHPEAADYPWPSPVEHPERFTRTAPKMTEEEFWTTLKEVFGVEIPEDK